MQPTTQILQRELATLSTSIIRFSMKRILFSKHSQNIRRSVSKRQIISMAAQRDFDIICWGSTGFTGQLVVRHIAGNYLKDGKLRFALHGRSEAKVKEVRSRLAKEYPGSGLEDLPLVIADARDQNAVDEAIARTNCVLSTAGPFARYGTPVVDAAVRLGTNYCDITGETHWVRALIDKYHETAAKNGVKIVPMCGYDSIPSDMGAYFTIKELQKKHPGLKASSCSMLITDSRGAVSGGTIETMANIIDTLPAAELKQMMEPFMLDPSGRPPPGVDPAKHADRWAPTYEKGHETWKAPFFMGPVNTRVVRRSNALMGFSYGPEMVYSEGIKVPSFLGATAVSAATAAGGIAMGTPIVKSVLRRWLPAQGEGPSRERQMSGYWVHKLHAEGTTPDGRAHSIVTVVRGKRDPGYWDTSRFLLESAILLATDLKEAEAAGLPGVKGGVLTPATAMGDRLVERLRGAGISFEVESLD